MIYQALSPTFYVCISYAENKWTSSTGGTVEIIIKLLFSRGYTRVITNAMSEQDGKKEGRRYRINFPYSSAKNPQVPDGKIYTKVQSCTCARKKGREFDLENRNLSNSTWYLSNTQRISHTSQYSAKRALMQTHVRLPSAVSLLVRRSRWWSLSAPSTLSLRARFVSYKLRKSSCRGGRRNGREKISGGMDSEGVIDARAYYGNDWYARPIDLRSPVPATIDPRFPPSLFCRFFSPFPLRAGFPGRISRITGHNGIYMVSHRDPFFARSHIHVHVSVYISSIRA